MNLKIFICLIIVCITSVKAQIKSKSKELNDFKIIADEGVENKNFDKLYVYVKNLEAKCNNNCNYKLDIIYMNAMYYSYMDQYKTAQKYFNEYLTYRNNDIEALSQRGVSYYSEGNFKLATQDYNTVLNLDSTQAIAYYMLSLMHDSISTFYIDKALLLDTDNVDYLNRKIDVLIKSNKCAEGLVVLGKIIEVNGVNEPNILTAADLLLCIKEYQKALDLLLSSNKEVPSEKFIERIVLTYDFMQKRDSMVYWLEELNKHYPKNTFSIVTLTEIRYSKNKMDAIKELNKLIYNSGNMPELYDFKAELFLRESNLDSAQIAINKAVYYSKNNPKYIYRKANLERARNDNENAYKDYCIFIESDSTSLEVLEFCSKYSFMKEDFNKAIYYCKKAENVGYKKQLIDVLVQSYFYSGQYELTKLRIDEWFNYQPSNESAINIKALMEACFGDANKAIYLCKYAQKNISKENDLPVKLTLALLYLTTDNINGFYNIMDLVILEHKNIFKNFITVKTIVSEKPKHPIQIVDKKGFEYLFTVTITETDYNLIKNRYKF
jgi:hypothetical protein